MVTQKQVDEITKVLRGEKTADEAKKAVIEEAKKEEIKSRSGGGGGRNKNKPIASEEKPLTKQEEVQNKAYQQNVTGYAPINPITGKAQVYDISTGQFKDTPYSNISYVQKGSSFQTGGKQKTTRYNINGTDYDIDIKPAELPSDYIQVRAGVENAIKAGYNPAAIVNAYQTGGKLLPSDITSLKSDVEKYKQQGYSNAEIVTGVAGLERPTEKKETAITNVIPDVKTAEKETYKQLASKIDLQTGNIKNETALEASGRKLSEEQVKKIQQLAKEENARVRKFDMETPEQYIKSPIRGAKKSGEFFIESVTPLSEQAYATTKLFATKKITEKEKKAFEESVSKQKEASQQALSDKDIQAAGGAVAFTGALAVPYVRAVAIGAGTVFGAVSTAERIKQAPTQIKEGKSVTGTVGDILVDLAFTVEGGKGVFGKEGAISKIAEWASTPEGGTPKVGKTETLTQKETPPQLVNIETTASEGAVSKGKGTFLSKPVEVVDVFSQTDITPVSAKTKLSKAIGLEGEYALLGERATTVKATLAKGEVFTQGTKGRAELVQNIEAVSTKESTKPDLFVQQKQVIKPVTDEIPLNKKLRREQGIDIAAKAQALGIEPSSTVGLPKGYAEARQAFAELNRPPEIPLDKQTPGLVKSKREVVSQSKGQMQVQIKIKGSKGKVTSQRVVRTKTPEGITQEQFVGEGRIRVPKGKPETLLENVQEARATSIFEQAKQTNKVEQAPSKNKTVINLVETEVGNPLKETVQVSRVSFDEAGSASKTISLESKETAAQFSKSSNVFSTGKEIYSEQTYAKTPKPIGIEYEVPKKVNAEPVPTAEQIRKKQKAFVEGLDKAAELRRQKPAPALPEVTQAEIDASLKSAREKFKKLDESSEVTAEQKAALNKELGQTENIFDTILKEQQQQKPQEQYVKYKLSELGDTGFTGKIIVDAEVPKFKPEETVFEVADVSPAARLEQSQKLGAKTPEGKFIVDIFKQSSKKAPSKQVETVFEEVDVSATARLEQSQKLGAKPHAERTLFDIIKERKNKKKKTQPEKAAEKKKEEVKETQKENILSGEPTPQKAQAEVSYAGQTAVFEQPVPQAPKQKTTREVVAEFFLKPFSPRPPTYQIPVTARQLAPTVRSQPQTFGVYSPLYGQIPRGASKVYISQPTPTSREQIRQSVQGQYKVFEEVGRLPREATRERESQKSVEKTLTQPATQYAIKPMQEQVVRVAQQEVIKPLTETRTPFIPIIPPISPIIRPPPTPIVNRLDRDEKKDKKKKGLFFARVRRKGVFQTVGKGSESYKEAFLKGLTEGVS